ISFKYSGYSGSKTVRAVIRRRTSSSFTRRTKDGVHFARMRSTVLSGTRRSLRRRRRSKVNSPAGDHPAFNNLCSVCQPIPWIWCIAINPSRSSIALPPKKRGTAGRSPENRCLFLRDALLKQTLLLQDLNQRLADVGRGGSHLHAAFLKLGDLFGGRSLSSGN